MIQEDLITAAEACALLRVHRSTLQRYMDEGKIRAFLIGRRLRIPRSELARMLEPRPARKAGDGEEGAA